MNINIKKIYLISFSFFLLFLGKPILFEDTFGFFHESGQVQNFIPYENPSMKFSIKYPSNWNVEERIGGFVTFTAPIEDYTQTKFPAGLGVYPINLESQNVSLTTLKNVHLNNITNNLKEFQLLDSRPISLAGTNSAYQLIFTALDGEQLKKSMQIIVKNQDKAYLITFKADLNKYDSYVNTAQKILDSLVLAK
ncbi:MAG: PsbP-related protein [Nitrososphaeraceae archaeon]